MEDAFAPDCAEPTPRRRHVKAPLVATPEMIAAAAGWRERDRRSGLTDEQDMFERIYSAMIGALPPQQQAAQARDGERT
jgi:hypothetical protein